MKCKRLLLMLLVALCAPWAAMAQQTTLTVCDGTTTNSYVPIYGSWVDTQGTTSEFIIPASTEGMSDMENGTISKLTFHLSSPATAAWGATFKVYMKEVENTTLSTIIGPDACTVVYTGVLDGNQSTLEIEFDDQYTYNGGNLLIGTYVQSTGSWKSASFYGITAANGSSIYKYSTYSPSTQAFLPKTTFTYTPGASTATPPVVTTNSTPTNLTNTSVTLGGTITDMGGATGVFAGICYSTSATPTTSDTEVHSRYTSAEAYTKDITGLLPNTTYYYRAFAYNSANSLADPTYGDIYSFTTGGNITLNQPANGEISASVAGGTATTSNTYALPGQSVSLTATAISGYDFDSWIVTGVTGTASGSTYTFTMPTNNVTVTASIVPTSGGSSSVNYYELASSVESGAKYLVVNGNGTTASASSSFYAMEWNNTTSTSGILDYGTPTFKDSEKHKITDITPHASGRSLSDYVWTITASGSDYTLSAENGGSTYYLIETSASDGNLHSYTTSNSSYNADQTKWKIEKASGNEYFVIHNAYWYSQYSTPGGRYYYLYRGSSGFQNWYTSTAPASVSSAPYFMYLYKETSTTTYAITATASPAEGGTVAGSDYYANGYACTLTATPAFGYDFVNWTEGGNVVSTSATYTFTVSSARTLVANFESQGSCIKPTDVAQVANTEAAHQAQLSWTENNEATQWQVVYSDDSDFDPDAATPVAVNENPTTITGLDQATTYYVYVRTICGQNSHSGWSNKASFVTISGHQAPTAVSYDPSTLTPNEVTVTWTGVATNVLHQSYDVYYSTSDVTPTSSQVPSFSGLTGTSKELTGLTSNTEYYVWVRDNCGTDGYSDWAGPETFTTACEAFTITSTYKYRQDFERPVVTSTYSSTTGLQIPNCWENPYTTGTNEAGNPHLVVAGGSYNYASSGQVLLFYGSGSNYVTLPEFNNDLQDLQISFKWATESSSYGTLTLGYITDGDVNYNTFTPITGASYPASSSSYRTLIQADPVELSALPATAKRLAFRWVYSSQYSCNVDDVVVELIPSCKVPTDLTCTDYTATTATFSWTANGANQTAWQLYISETNVAPSDDIDPSLVINANTNPFTVTSGLTAEHTYYAWVRGNCTASSEGYSEWSEGIEFMPSQYKDFTYQETASSSTGYLPIYGSYTNNETNKGQILIPATYFPAEMLDATVRRLTFYTTSSYATADWGAAEFDVLVAEVDETSFATAAFFDWDAMTTVYSGSLSVSDNQMVINLDTPFSYTGGNLVIGFNLTTTGTTKYVSWVATYGSTNLGAYQYSTYSVNSSYYQPKTTFNYMPNATPRPLNPHATEELSTEATVAWTAPNSTEVTGYQYQYKLETDTEWPATWTDEPGLSANITGLTPEMTYDFRVRAVYPGPAYSQDAETQFTTTASCPIPDGFTATNLTQNTADLTWNASSEVANYTVEYRTAAGMQAVFEEGFEDDTEFANWTLNNCVSGTGRNSSAKRTDNYGFKFAYNGYSSGITPPQYLISPDLSAYTANDVMLAFYYTKGSSSYTETFKVGWSSTTDDPTAFTWDSEITATSAWDYYSHTIPAGTKYISIAYTADDHLYLYIDDLAIGNIVAAGTWTEATTTAPNTGAYTLGGLTAGIKYDVRVYANCTSDPDSESATTTFTTLADGNKVFTNATADGKWSTADNWAPAGAPVITDNAILRANATIESGTVAQAKKITFEGTTTPTLTINDGGQLKTDNSVTATVKKNISKYTYDGTDPEHPADGYCLIASPFNTSYYPTNFGLITDPATSYDLYSWNGTASDGLEWRNYKKVGGFTFATATGYLYANANNVEFSYSNTVRANNVVFAKSVSYTAAPSGSNEFSDWNLIGNPFVCNAYLISAETDGTALPYYKMNAAGSGFEAVPAGNAIAPIQGIFYQYQSTVGNYVYFTRTAPSAKSGQLNMNLNRNNKQLDNAILVFGGDQQLGKMTFRANSSKVYMPVEGKDYAITSVEGQVGEVPVSFKAENNGTYSLSFTSEEVSFSYLHLIDNMTGADVDLLANPTYSFDARTTDYESRFRLVFATGSSVDGDSFGFINGMGNLTIFGIEGEATLQVIDVTGRMLSSETFSGSYEKRLNVAPGVYMLRLVNGNDVKVQKMVVR